MDADRAQLNRFLVEVFHDVMRLEAQELLKGPFKNLSVSEMHVIEAVCDGQAKKENTMAALAARLRVSAGSLTIAAKTLEQKGYLTRQRSKTDRRRVLVLPTSLGEKAYEVHRAFHRRMVDSVFAQLEAGELEALTHALEVLHRFFSGS